MMIENYRNGPEPVYRRFRERGRMAPAGLVYISSWVEEGLNRCFQLMETSEPALLGQWTANWADLVDFEIVPVVSSTEAAEAVARMGADRASQGRQTHSVTFAPLSSLDKEGNDDLLRFLAAAEPSAHSDVADALLGACRGLGEYSLISPRPEACSYVVVATCGIGFAVAHGMDRISIRLPAPLVERAVISGAEREPRIGASWVTYILFRSDWPVPDLVFWLRKAYAFLRETDCA